MIDALKNVFEGLPPQTIRIRDVTVLLPTIQQHHLSAGLWGHAHQAGDMISLHGQHEIGITQHRWCDLSRTMRSAIHPALTKDFTRQRIHALAHQRAKTGALDGDAR